MAEGLLSAILSSGNGETAQNIVVAEKIEARRTELAGKYGVRVTESLEEVAEKCDIVFLAVRPQDVTAVAECIRGKMPSGRLLVSIVAGKTLAALKQAFGENVRIVRVMPNLALRVGEGMCAVCGNDADTVVGILSKAGEAIKLDEKDFDAVTALSGSGPAYFAYMAKAMADAGIRLGLSPDVALLLSVQTMLGTARFLRSSNVPLDDFIAGVCTKGGTTAAGMEKLDPSNFREIVADTLSAAAARSRLLN